MDFLSEGGGDCKGVFFLGGKGEVMGGQFFRGVIGGGQYTHTNEGYPMLLLSGGGVGVKSFFFGEGVILVEKNSEGANPLF